MQQTNRDKSKSDIMERRLPFEPEMVLIPAGEFLMGSDPNVDKDEYGNERPQHTLHLPDYYLSRTPVTNAQYTAFVQATGHEEHKKPRRYTENYPVVNVSWYDAMAYCRWLAEVAVRAYCLPSEAEWEKGARGSDGRIYPWGNEWDQKRCNSDEGQQETTTLVGAYPEGASPYGLQDMAGNVWEWTRSLWGKALVKPLSTYPYHPADGREDTDAPDSILRVLRGGAFDFKRWDVRCAARDGYLPRHFTKITGFRVAVVPSGLAKAKFDLLLSEAPEGANQREQRQTRILVIEDSQSLVRLYERLLEKAGYHVLTAYNGAEGLKKAQWGKPDLIILDIIMSVMDGYEVWHRLQNDPATADIPVLMLTRVKGRPPGFDSPVLDFLSKPVAAKEMLARVSVLLRRCAG